MVSRRNGSRGSGRSQKALVLYLLCPELLLKGKRESVNSKNRHRQHRRAFVSHKAMEEKWSRVHFAFQISHRKISHRVLNRYLPLCRPRRKETRCISLTRRGVRGAFKCQTRLSQITNLETLGDVGHVQEGELRRTMYMILWCTQELSAQESRMHEETR